MALTPDFALSAANPQHHGYDPTQPDVRWAYARLLTFGGATFNYAPYTLGAQHSDDSVLLARSPATAGNVNNLGSYPTDVYSKSAALIGVSLQNVKDDHQVLFVFQFKRFTGGTEIQFFTGSSWVRTESVDDPTETMALLIDLPPGSGPNVYVQVVARVGGGPSSGVFLEGLEGFII